MRLSTWDGIFAIQYTTLNTGTFLTTFLLVLGTSEFLIGLVAAFPLLMGLVQPIGAEIIRRRGGWRRPVAVSAALIEDLTWVPIIAAALFYPPKIASVVIVGLLAAQQLANAFVGVSWTSWISDLIPPRLRGRYFGRRNFICHSLGAVTAILAGMVVDRSGADPIPVFAAIFTVGLVFRLVSITILAHQPEPAPARSPRGSFLKQLSHPLSHDGFRRFLIYAMLWGFAVHLAAPFFTVFMIRSAKIDVGDAMLFAAFSTIANLLGQRFWGPMCDRYGDHQVLRVAGIIICMQPFGWMFADGSTFGYYLMMALSMTGGFSWGGHLLAVGNLMMRLAPETGKTSFFAMQAALGGLFGALGPFVGGVIADYLMVNGSLLPGWIFADLKTLFVLSFVVRLTAWGLLFTVPDPVGRPRLRAVVVLRDAVKTFNPVQGFSPLLHVFAAGPRRVRPRRRSAERPED
ncbi:MAG TPA: MFS transporter [Rhodothermales bacterium]